jgi:hypothetical protein
VNKNDNYERKMIANELHEKSLMSIKDLLANPTERSNCVAAEYDSGCTPGIIVCTKMSVRVACAAREFAAYNNVNPTVRNNCVAAE